MKTISLLEELAHHAHHRVQLNSLLTMQSETIQRAFLTNDASKLKNCLNNLEILADRSFVVRF